MQARHLFLSCAAACIHTASPAAFAYQPLVTDDTGTQGMGGNQLEFAWVHEHEETGATTRTNSVPLVYTRGLSDALDLAVGLPWLRSNASGNGQSGTGNPTLALKWRFHEVENGWSIALKPEIAFPVSAANEAKGHGDHGTAYNATLIFSRETPFGEFHVNAGAGHYDAKVAGNDADSCHLSVAPAWRLAESTLLALDIGLDHENPEVGGSDTSHYVLLGLVHSPNENLDLAAGLQKTFSVNGSDNVWMGTVGVTWRF